MPLPRNLNRKSGFTLIEILVTIGILLMLTSLGLIVTIDFYKTYAFNSERDVLVSMLEKARSRSLNNINQQPHGVHVQNGKYTIYNGNVYNPVDTTNEVVDANPGITSIGSTLTDINFAQLSGDANLTGNFVLNLDNGKRITTISINSEGQINW